VIWEQDETQTADRGVILKTNKNKKNCEGALIILDISRIGWPLG
jgi:hypothetical protein